MTNFYFGYNIFQKLFAEELLEKERNLISPSKN